jgi:hypothetical protein
MRRMLAIGALVAGLGAVAWFRHRSASEPPSAAELAAITRTSDIYSDVFTIDRKYRSMMGPTAVVAGSLGDADPPELLWVTGYRAIMVEADGDREMSQDFMCHANMNLDIEAHRERFGWEKNASRRLFTLSQGQSVVRFPAGFGIPIASNERISVEMQVLNLVYEGAPISVRHKVTVEYVRDADLVAPMKPLFMKAATGLVSLGPEQAHYQVEHADPQQHGEGCLMGEAAAGKPKVDRFGREFSGHWVVPPGRQENHTLVTESMRIPFDTTVHYIAAHVHPFAESIALRDLTTGETLFTSHARNFEDRIGLREVEFYSSPVGFPLYDDHEYELVSIYDNTSGEDQDSMAVLFIYALDREFERPKDLR